MFHCFVCKMQCELSADLQNHMQRHRKADLISAVIRLPSDSESEVSTLPCTSECCSEEQKDPSKEEKTDEDAEHVDFSKLEEINNNLKQGDKLCKKKSTVRRSCRLKVMNKHDSLKDHMYESIDDSYYIPPDDEGKAKMLSVFSDDSEDDVKPSKRAKGKKVVKSEGRKKGRLEPVFLTPKVEKEPTSETDSCSGNALSESSAERLFCTYCGSGYRTQSILADHIRHNHLNFCGICETHIPDARRFKEHQQVHATAASRVYACAYCKAEYTNRDMIDVHTQRHLQEVVVADVLSLEEDYFSERSYMNTMYNMFNAGYMYGKRTAAAAAASSGAAAAGSGSSSRLPTEFYQVFLQYASADVEHVERYGYLCRTCGFTLFDRSHYRDHMQIAHGVTTSDVERLLSI